MSEQVKARCGILDIDHVMINVDDLDAAADRFRALGFVVTPGSFSRMPELPFANMLVWLQPLGPGVENFIELMHVSEPSLIPATMRNFLGERTGLRTIVLKVDDKRFYEELSKDGFDVDPPWRGNFDWMPQGLKARFPAIDRMPVPNRAPVLPAYGQFPVYFNGYDWDAQEIGRPRALSDHANSAQSLTGVLARSSSPFEHASLMAELWGAQLGAKTRDFYSVTPRWMTLHLGPTDWLSAVAPVNVHPLFGIEIAVGDLDKLSTHLISERIPFSRAEEVVSLWDNRLNVLFRFYCPTLVAGVT